MASITLTPSEKEIQAFLKHYQTSLAPSKNPYIRYFLKLPQATVSIYTSGKVLLQGEGAEKYASFLVDVCLIQSLTPPSLSSNVEPSCPIINEYGIK